MLWLAVLIGMIAMSTVKFIEPVLSDGDSDIKLTGIALIAQSRTKMGVTTKA
jgi:hypothetical protein